jgi:uncharacterized membrane protein (DUF2068 family)
MSRIRYLAAGLLGLTGVVHVAQLAVATLDASTVITVLFGVAYLVIGVFLFRDNRTAYYFGTIVPLVGLVLATLGMLTNPTILAAIFIAIDVVIVLSCFYLIFKSRRSAWR